MRRLYFCGEHKFRVAELFGSRPRFRAEDYTPYQKLEIVWHDDGRYSVWGDLEDDADLLRDTCPDPHHLVKRTLPLADEVLTEEE